LALKIRVPFYKNVLQRGDVIQKISLSKITVFAPRAVKKAQQNETLHPTGTTHTPIDQGIFQIGTKAIRRTQTPSGGYFKRSHIDSHIISYL
jgi:hypothetical protein